MPDNGLPEGWSVARLGDVATVETGGTPSRARPEFWGGTVRWMSSGEVNRRRVAFTAEFITEAGVASSNAKVFPPGTLMLAMNGQGSTRGKVAVLEVEAACNQSLAAIRGKNGVDSRYLLHNLDSRYDELRNLTGDDARSGLNLGLIRGFRLNVPPPDEQRRIAEVLDSVDAAIEKTEAVIAETERLRSALLGELLTRGVPGWHTEWKQVPGIGTIPACWEVVRLGDVADVQTGRQVGKAPGNGAPVVLPYLSVANVKDGYLHLETVKTMAVGASEVARFSLRPGDVLFTEGGDADKLGRGCVWNREIEQCLHQNHVFAVRPHARRLSPDLLAAYARSSRGKAYFMGCSKQTTNLASINSTQLNAMPLPLPPLDEQRAMLDALQSVAGRAEWEKAELEALIATKRAAAASLLSGRVRIGGER